MFALDAPLPHAWARDPSRQREIPECRCKLFLAIRCDDAGAVQAVLQQPAHVLVTCLVIFGRQFDKYLSSCCSVEARPPHVDQCHNLSSTFTCCDPRQHHFQRLIYLARTLGFPGCPLSVSAYPVLMGALPISRRHTSLGTLVRMLWRRMYSTSSRPALAHSSGSSHPPLLSSQCHHSHMLSSSCSS